MYEGLNHYGGTQITKMVKSKTLDQNASIYEMLKS